MMNTFRAPPWLVLKNVLLALGFIGALHAAAVTQAEASASCTAVNSGSFNLTNSAFDPGNTSILTGWAVGDRITATFTDEVGFSHSDGFFHGPTLAVIGALEQGTVTSGGNVQVMHTVVSADLTNGILLDPENNDSITATCITALVLTSTPSSTLHVNQSYSQSNVASGGTPSYTYSVDAGTLPAGTSLDTSTGLVSGTPTVGGNFNYTIRVTDSSPAPALTMTQVISGNIAGATSTSISSSANPSVLGFPVKFTATVSSSGGTPTGTVTFKSGEVTLGTGPLINGIATFTTSSLTVGSHSITAAYGGDANFGISASSPLTQIVAVTNVYVLPKGGSDSGVCPITAPCATLNYALSVTGAGGQVTVLGAGQFGPVVLTKEISIIGIDPQIVFEIDANPAVQVGCVGGSVGTCSVNNGYGVEIAAGANDTVKLTNSVVTAGASGAGALKLTSGGQLQLTDNVYRGNDTMTGPIVALYPNNPGATQVQVLVADSDIGFCANGGAVEVKPSANTSLKLQFNRVEVHNASFGIRTDSSSLSGPSVSATTSISASKFFSFANAAVNAFSTTGAGITNAVFDELKILNASVGVKANGAQSIVILTNSTISGNAIGVQPENGGIVYTSTNNTIYGNGTDFGNSMTTAPKQ